MDSAVNVQNIESGIDTSDGEKGPYLRSPSRSRSGSGNAISSHNINVAINANEESEKAKRKEKVFGLFPADVIVHPVLLLIQFIFSLWHVLGKKGK